MRGLKAELKAFLRKNGIKTVTLDDGSTVKLQQAKTSVLFNEASKLGF